MQILSKMGLANMKQEKEPQGEGRGEQQQVQQQGRQQGQQQGQQLVPRITTDKPPALNLTDNEMQSFKDALNGDIYNTYTGPSRFVHYILLRLNQHVLACNDSADVITIRDSPK